MNAERGPTDDRPEVEGHEGDRGRAQEQRERAGIDPTKTGPDDRIPKRPIDLNNPHAENETDEQRARRREEANRTP